MFQRAISSYQKVLTKRPYLVQAIQAGTLMGSGDIISQLVIEQKTVNNYDLRRTTNFMSIGFFVGGPALRLWYGALNKHFGSGGKSATVKKVLLDQCVFAPTFLCFLLGAVSTLQGQSWHATKSNLKQNYPDVLKANYFIWPWVQLVNFYYIPLQYQVLAVQTVALFWNTYLSWKTNKVYVQTNKN